MDVQNLLNQTKDVLGEIKNLLESNNVPGPYSRTRAYEFRKLLGDCRVFQFTDIYLASYYVVDVSTPYGRRLYDELWNKRLLLNRLRKELYKL